MPKTILYKDLGVVDYKKCWDDQEVLFKENVDIKLFNRLKNQNLPTKNYLLFCEHPHVYTLGKSGDANNLLINSLQLSQKKATYYKINRGGDITYHGPGQLVVYPILDLENFFTDIHKYLRFLEEAVILSLADFGIPSGRIEGLTGVWINPDDKIRTKKICAMGVRCSRWITMHGLALNVNPDLSYFNNIVPCGITDKAVTSMQQELGREVDIEKVKNSILKHLIKLFGFKIIVNGE